LLDNKKAEHAFKEAKVPFLFLLPAVKFATTDFCAAKSLQSRLESFSQKLFYLAPQFFNSP
jgi:hypothetical protein